MTLSAEGVGVMEGPSFLQVAVVLIASWLQPTLADSQQVIEDEVAVVNLEPQHVVLLSLEVGEVLLPPGVGVVVANRRFAQ